jgi:hypothetical protein
MNKRWDRLLSHALRKKISARILGNVEVGKMEGETKREKERRGEEEEERGETEREKGRERERVFIQGMVTETDIGENSHEFGGETLFLE